MGSGSEAMGHPVVVSTILNLWKNSKESTESSVATELSDQMSSTNQPYGNPTVLYIGTATYDLPVYKERQTCLLREAGCVIQELLTVTERTDTDIAKRLIDSADIILVSGGNTLFAVSMWMKMGYLPWLKAAAHRGAILTGGSAGIFPLAFFV